MYTSIWVAYMHVYITFLYHFYWYVICSMSRKLVVRLGALDSDFGSPKMKGIVTYSYP